MQFQDDIRQDIKTFWGIPIGKMLKVLVPLGIVLAAYILWFPFPDILWRMGSAIAVFILAAGGMALNLPKFCGIYKRYRKRQKILPDKPGVKNPDKELTSLQDLIRVDKLHYMDKLVLEWDNGWVSVLCQVKSQPIEYESPATVSLIKRGLKDALAIASANSLRLNWIDDADFEYDEDFWDERRKEALSNIFPGGKELTLERLADYEKLARFGAVSNRLLLRIDGSLTHLMREENGETDLERKESALESFSHLVEGLMNSLEYAKLELTPLWEDDLIILIEREAAPWTRGRGKSPRAFLGKSKEYPATQNEENTLYSLESSSQDIDYEIRLEDPTYPEPEEIPATSETKTKELKPVPSPPAFGSTKVKPVSPAQNPFAKTPVKSLNPFVKNDPGKITPEKTRQKVVPFLKPLQLPGNVVVVFGAKRYAGVTTVCVNLTLPGGLLINFERGDQPLNWPEHFTVWPLSGENRVGEIVKMAERFDQVTVDLGIYSEDCLDVLKAAQKFVYVTDNQPGSLGVSLKQTEHIKEDKVILLAINKAAPSGLSPGLLGTQLGMPVGILIPFDGSYGDNFALSLPRKPWDIFRNLIKEREVAGL